MIILIQLGKKRSNSMIVTGMSVRPFKIILSLFDNKSVCHMITLFSWNNDPFIASFVASKI